MARLVAQGLKAPLHTAFVGSTGVIGRPLRIDKIRAGFPSLMNRLRRGGSAEAAKAILTTDLRTKQVVIQRRLGGRTVTIGGMAKGSGMIHPDMATMLAYLTTDADISRSALQQALTAAVGRTFNCISVDGDTSTNDTVLCLANCQARNIRITEGSADFRLFRAMLTQACEDLALRICRDGEGVTKVAKILVTGAKTHEDAHRVANTIATSNLVKTALFGEDANWGRVMAAAGRAGVQLHSRSLSLSFDGVPMVRQGVGLGARSERKIAAVFRKKEFTIRLDLGQGSAQAHVWTTDLSYDYVRINASYRS
jgi:glutamate N-acetyltransferase/amino-acid N-acetyltransferase